MAGVTTMSIMKHKIATTHPQTLRLFISSSPISLSLSLSLSLSISPSVLKVRAGLYRGFDFTTFY
jgi:hypothetical protein